MAGSFGFEKEKYDVSLKCAGQVLTPAIAQCSADTLVVTNGFSCRAQIEELTGRRPLHPAELLQMSLDGRKDGQHR
jgi:Fe-S oxidoreductase